MSSPKVIRVYADGRTEEVKHWSGGRYEVLRGECPNCGSSAGDRFFESEYASDRNTDVNGKRPQGADPQRPTNHGTIVLIERKELSR